jgi:hypothetical protein
MKDCLPGLLKQSRYQARPLDDKDEEDQDNKDWGEFDQLDGVEDNEDVPHNNKSYSIYSLS